MFIVRARQEPDSEYRTTVGAAWRFKQGEGYAVRLQTVPVNWDGSCVLVPPSDER